MAYFVTIDDRNTKLKLLSVTSIFQLHRLLAIIKIVRRYAETHRVSLSVILLAVNDRTSQVGRVCSSTNWTLVTSQKTWPYKVKRKALRRVARSADKTLRNTRGLCKLLGIWSCN